MLFASLPFDVAPFRRQGKQDEKAHASTGIELRLRRAQRAFAKALRPRQRRYKGTASGR